MEKYGMEKDIIKMVKMNLKLAMVKDILKKMIIMMANYGLKGNI